MYESSCRFQQRRSIAMRIKDMGKRHTRRLSFRNAYEAYLVKTTQGSQGSICKCMGLGFTRPMLVMTILITIPDKRISKVAPYHDYDHVLPISRQAHPSPHTDFHNALSTSLKPRCHHIDGPLQQAPRCYQYVRLRT